MTAHLIRRVAILGTGLIGGSFALALRKNLRDIHISGWDRPEVVREPQVRRAFDETFSGNLGRALEKADLIYIALPIAVTLDILSEIASHAPASALVTDLFRGHTYALIAEGDAIATPTASEPRIAAFVKILEKIGAQPLWIGAQQHDYAVGLASHLPQLTAVALAAFLYDRLDENGLPITLAGPGLRDTLRLAGSPYSTWRDIVLTNRELLSASLDLFARRLDDLRERLASRDLEADFESANELYKLLRSL